MRDRSALQPAALEDLVERPRRTYKLSFGWMRCAVVGLRLWKGPDHRVVKHNTYDQVTDGNAFPVYHTATANRQLQKSERRRLANGALSNGGIVVHRPVPCLHFRQC